MLYIVFLHIYTTVFGSYLKHHLLSLSSLIIVRLSLCIFIINDTAVFVSFIIFVFHYCLAACGSLALSVRVGISRDLLAWRTLWPAGGAHCSPSPLTFASHFTCLPFPDVASSHTLACSVIGRMRSDCLAGQDDVTSASPIC